MKSIVKKTSSSLSRDLLQAKAQGKKIALVPTMGALHQGHAFLIKRARRENDFVVASIFVNPTQFGPKEDYTKYPRKLSADAALAKKSGADLVFAPFAKEIYPKGAKKTRSAGELGKILCGKTRQGHFDGVATVVFKLFKIVQPDAAYFGQKDFQQTLVVKKLVSDLKLPVKIIVCPTVREKSGLAKSSRNAYLSLKERKAAAGLFRALSQAKKLFDEGERDAVKLREKMLETLEKEPLAKVDYAEIRGAQTLAKVKTIGKKSAVALLAVFIGKTRLIDNLVLS